MDYEQLKIKSYKYWDLYLHENQCYLGRAFALLREDAGVEDFLAIEGAMRDEFFSIGQDFKAVLKTLFQPDKMNYAALSNTSPQIHVHLVPRYKESREFAGIIFKDTRWGKNYAPYDRSFELDESVLFQIRDSIQQQIDSY
jgi:diadenosine tetraphosphate (Ap4A) HIT family hydrolase